MTKNIDKFVSKNRENINTINSTLTSISSQTSKNIQFIQNEIVILFELVIETRSTGNSLISGHPDGDTHGSGNGVSGDDRGSWNQQTNEISSESFVNKGRKNLKNAIAGDSGESVSETAIGTDSTLPSRTDTDLGNETSRVFTWSKSSGSGKALCTSEFRFHQTGSVIKEVGVFNENNQLYGRILPSSNVSVTQGQEVRTETTLKVEGIGKGNSVITVTGQDEISEVFYNNSTKVGFRYVAFGSGTTSPAINDTSLETKELEKTAKREVTESQMTALAYVLNDEPSSQPVDISEIGILDEDKNLIWRATFEPFNKDNTITFQSEIGFFPR